MIRTERMSRLILALSLSCAVGLAGCGRTSMPPMDDADSAPPEIPPASTMVMEFDDFQTGARTSNQLIETWGRSFFNVAVWSTLVTVTLAIPVAAFQESFNHEPERRTDGTWVWRYDVPVNGATLSAELTAEAVESRIEWNMFLSQSDGFQNVNWFSGMSNLTATSGTWRLNMDPDDPQPFLDIEWSRDPSGVPSEIRYTNIIPDEPNNGGYIQYGVTADGDYDRVYEIYLPEGDDRVNIEWNSVTRAGRLMEPNHFGDSEWHCWDADLLDAECPAP